MKSKKSNVKRIPKDAEENENEMEINIDEIGTKKYSAEPQNINIVAFWRPTDQHGWLGQWYRSDFELTDEVLREFPDEIKNLNLYKKKSYVIKKLMEHKTFSTAEKFMMMGKAALFMDNVIYNKMALTESPREHKKLGQKVKNFSEGVWKMYCQDIVKIGSYLKFSQNDELKDKLIKTYDKVIVEASPLDKIWGIGLKFDDPNIKDKTKWRGTNYLGECLMFVRNLF